MARLSRVLGWTESRYWGYIRSSLRRAFSRYPNKYKVLAASKEGRNQYRCAGCGTIHGKKEVAVDHIEACGSLKSYEDVSVFIDRMFCSIEGLQILCKVCHHRKTMQERGLSEADIASLWFKKLKAKEQKKYLESIDVEPASNAADRLVQYQDNL